MSVGPRLEKFNIVSNDHGRTQMWDFCVSVCKTNFTDHHTPDKIHSFRDSVLVCKMHGYRTIRKNSEYFHSFPSIYKTSIKRCKRLQRLARLYKTNHFKMLLDVFSTTYTYPNWILFRLFSC